MSKWIFMINFESNFLKTNKFLSKGQTSVPTFSAISTDLTSHVWSKYIEKNMEICSFPT